MDLGHRQSRGLIKFVWVAILLFLLLFFSFSIFTDHYHNQQSDNIFYAHQLTILRSAVGMTHSLRSDLWWTIPFRVLLSRVHFGESLVNRLYSEIDQTYLCIEAQCVSHYYPRWTATVRFGSTDVWWRNSHLSDSVKTNLIAHLWPIVFLVFCSVRRDLRSQQKRNMLLPNSWGLTSQLGRASWLEWLCSISFVSLFKITWYLLAYLTFQMCFDGTCNYHSLYKQIRHIYQF